MDGNTRWATARGLPSRAGHAAGAAALVDTVSALSAWRACDALTVFAFSSENWGRGATASSSVLAVVRRAARVHAGELAARGVRLAVVGNRAALPPSLNDALDEAIEATAGGTSMTLTVALAYGGRADAASAAATLARAAAAGTLDPATIDETTFADALALSAVLPSSLRDPDIVIRTSGERRLSNFVLFGAAYSELVFIDELWPDVTPAVLARALHEYAGRDRRFGGVGQSQGR